jgi:hypothetical protein
VEPDHPDDGVAARADHARLAQVLIATREFRISGAERC